MDKSRLLEVWTSLSKWELRGLEKYLKSPIHNHRQDVIELFDYLELNGENKTLLSKINVANKLYPQEAFDDLKMRRLMSFLLLRIEDYLAFEEYKQDKLQASLYLARAYRKRNLNKSFNSSLVDAKKKQQSSFYKDSYFYLNDYTLYKELYQHKQANEGVNSLDIKQPDEALEIFFITEKLRQACILISLRKKEDLEKGKSLMDTLLRQVKKFSYDNFPVLAVYYNAYKALTEIVSISYFDTFKSKLEKHADHFSTEELQDVYLLGISYCKKQIEVGKINFQKTLFEFYEQGLEDEIFINRGFISHRIYEEIVLAAIHQKVFDWAESFIRKYRNFIAIEYRENSYHFNMANLMYFQKKYKNASHHITKVRAGDPLLFLDAKLIRIKMEYEQGREVEAKDLVESLKKVVRKKKMDAYHKKNYQNNARLMDGLLKLNAYMRREKDELWHDILNVLPLSEKDWLLKQITLVNMA